MQLYARSKPTSMITCTIIVVIMKAMSNRSLQVLNTIKTNKRIRMFNTRVKLAYLLLKLVC